MKRTPFLKLLKSIIRIFFLSYALFLFFTYIFQARLIFLPSKIPKGFTYNFDSEFTEYNDTIEGNLINSVLFSTPESKGLILYFHGNAGDMRSWGEVAQEITEKTHWNVWMIDFPGYGKSEGKISTAEDLYKVGTYFYQKSKNENPEHKVVLYGRSIGSGIASHLASQNNVDGLILESPYEYRKNKRPFKVQVKHNF